MAPKGTWNQRLKPAVCPGSLILKSPFGYGSKLKHQGTEMAMAQKDGDQNGTQGYMEPKTKTCGLPWLFNFETTIWVWVKTKAPGDRNGYGSKTWRPKWHPRVHGIKD